jgi:adenylylsulfate kinase
MLKGKGKTTILFIKSFIYRVYSSIIAFLVAYAFTGNAKLSAYIGIVENILKIVTYYWFDIVWEKLAVKKYKNCVVWLTGLSGAGKTTIAKKLFEELQAQGKPAMILDGDEIREIFKNTGFDKKSRDEHVKNVGRTAAFLQRRGAISIVSMISPYRDVRKECRDMATEFVEVYVNTSLKVCEERDVKGLYKKARAGEIKQFTGIHDDAPYEAPTNPDIKIDTTGKTVDECVEQILNHIRRYK